MKYNVVFMGTPEFAVPTLEKLNEKHNVSLVITRKDKKANRGKMQAPPVKIKALELGLEVKQFEDINSDEVKKCLKEINPDFIVVVAYGKILKKWLIDLPKYSIINLHASILPKLRGAAPIQYAILEGFDKTGISIMKIDEGLDTGDVYSTVEMKIDDKINGGELHDKLKILALDELIKVMDNIANNQIIPISQDDSIATYSHIIKKQDYKIDWNKSVTQVYNKIRAFSPKPNAYTVYDDIRIKIVEANIVSKDSKNIDNLEAGTILNVYNDSFDVLCGNGILNITKIKPEGSSQMSVEAYLLGHSIEKGKIL